MNAICTARRKFPCFLVAAYAEFNAGKLYSTMTSLADACSFAAMPAKTDSLKDKIRKTLSSKALSIDIAGQKF